MQLYFSDSNNPCKFIFTIFIVIDERNIRYAVLSGKPENQFLYLLNALHEHCVTKNSSIS